MDKPLQSKKAMKAHRNGPKSCIRARSGARNSSLEESVAEGYIFFTEPPALPASQSGGRAAARAVEASADGPVVAAGGPAAAAVGGVARAQRPRRGRKRRWPRSWRRSIPGPASWPRQSPPRRAAAAATRAPQTPRTCNLSGRGPGKSARRSCARRRSMSRIRCHVDRELRAQRDSTLGDPSAATRAGRHVGCDALRANSHIYVCAVKVCRGNVFKMVKVWDLPWTI